MAQRSPLLDDGLTHGPAPKTGKEHLKALVKLQGIVLKWEGGPHYTMTQKEQRDLLVTMIYAIIFTIYMGGFGEEGQEFYGWPAILFLVFIALTMGGSYVKRYFEGRSLYYGANEDGVWVANAKGVSFYPITDLSRFETDPNDSFEICCIKAIYAPHRQKRGWLGEPPVAFKLRHLPHCYRLRQQLTAWHRARS